MLVTVGADRKIWLYDGKTGEPKQQVGEGVHGGSVFGVSWAKDSNRFVTSSADQTVKIWDAETGKVTQDWRLGEDSVVSISDHQVGVVWPAGRSDGLIISLSLSGDLNYLSEGSKKPVKVVQGHQKSITTLSHGKEGSKASETLWTGSYDGRICSWDVQTGRGETAEGSSHSNYVSGLTGTPHGSGDIFSVGWDDTLRTIDASAKTFTGGAIKLESQPKGIASTGSKVLVAANEAIEIFEKGKKVGEVQAISTPTSIAASSSGPIQVAVGDESRSIHCYTLTESLNLEHTLPPSSSAITALAFSTDGKFLATGNSSGKIVVYDTKSYQVVIDRWSSHTARITSIAWNEKGTHAVSGSLDTNVFLWSVVNPGKRVKATNAHKDGVNGVAWIDGDSKVASAGGDAAIKIWKITMES
jgi:WD40 repeat protein